MALVRGQQAKWAEDLLRSSFSETLDTIVDENLDISRWGCPVNVLTRNRRCMVNIAMTVRSGVSDDAETNLNIGRVVRDPNDVGRISQD